ncbi:MAG: ABC transporter ATP-binding protein [Clostridia bacterium]|nr:ABC transporter ATP-binding protein [Clostridia bacterium]
MVEENKKKKKEPKRKPKYKTWYCVKWLIKKTLKWDKKMLVFSLLLIPIAVALYALDMYIPPIILEKLQTSISFNTVALTIVVLVAAQYGFRMIKTVMDNYSSKSMLRNGNVNYQMLLEKQYSEDSHNFLFESIRKLYDRAFKVLKGLNGGSAINVIVDFKNVVVNVICFFLFGTIINMLSPWITLLLLVGSLATFFMGRWKASRDYCDKDQRDANDKKMQYMYWTMPRQYKNGKDIRVFSLLDYIESTWNKNLRENIRLLHVIQNRWSIVQVVSFLIALIRDGLAYYFLINGAVDGTITPSQFVLYFSAISQMSGFIGGILGYFSSLHDNVLLTSDFIECIEEERGKFNHGEGIPVPKDRPVSLELRNVTFKYPDSDKNVLEHIDLKIEAGEKISLVGVNGAGKTTIVKLLCGLCWPDEGEVLIDGHSVFEYNRDELYTLFSLVPQEYTVLPTSVAENIALCDKSEIDEERLKDCIDEVGLTEKITSLGNGIDTGMIKKFDVNAVEFSGGEMQRLLLARSLYRKASVLVLDEPTAALDPIAENEVYKKYNEYAAGKTSVFISHRLASTRFCDKIYLLDDAKIIEAGTHDELMQQNGKYAEMFNVQARYYREGGEIND